MLSHIFHTFFDKRNILISIRYQLHPASATTRYQELIETSRMHTAKNKEKKVRNKEKQKNIAPAKTISHFE
jgi:hypothetical protein